MLCSLVIKTQLPHISIHPKPPQRLMHPNVSTGMLQRIHIDGLHIDHQLILQSPLYCQRSRVDKKANKLLHWINSTRQRITKASHVIRTKHTIVINPTTMHGIRKVNANDTRVINNLHNSINCKIHITVEPIFFRVDFNLHAANPAHKVFPILPFLHPLSYPRQPNMRLPLIPHLRPNLFHPLHPSSPTFPLELLEFPMRKLILISHELPIAPLERLFPRIRKKVIRINMHDLIPLINHLTHPIALLNLPTNHHPRKLIRLDLRTALLHHSLLSLPPHLSHHEVHPRNIQQPLVKQTQHLVLPLIPLHELLDHLFQFLIFPTSAAICKQA